jgi:A/G-specific adenine glycosylase
MQTIDTPATARTLRSRLLRWYRANRRDLPWRATRDPYRVWVSEIMLQQTRVPVVLDFYPRFLRRFPTLGALARAHEKSVLAAWSGLGYYRRARALHRAARQMMRDGGKVPRRSSELRMLPGIGRYTAAAIASIAFDEPCAVVDGNVERVLQRLTGRRLNGKELWECAEALLSRQHPGDFNQAMMELGATVCVPGQPRCEVCPLLELCVTRGRVPAAPKVARHKRQIVLELQQRDQSVWLVQRNKQDSLMPAMWELPQSTTPLNGDQPLMRLKHSITSTDYEVAVIQSNGGTHARGRWFPMRALPRVALTGLARKVLRRANLLG